MADAVRQSIDEVLDSSCHGVRVSADLSDFINGSCKQTQHIIQFILKNLCKYF